MTAREVLDGIKATSAEITPGQWEVDRNYPFSQDLVGIFAKDAQKYVVQVENQHDVDDPTSDADAEFIAAAPSTVARLTRAIEDVLELHAPDTYGECRRCADGPGFFHRYPCPTVAAIEDALNPKEGQ